MNKPGAAVNGLLIEAVELAKVFRSVLLPPSCRFSPSCSKYAVEALARHTLASAARLVGARLLRCHPWHPGGLDPVP